MPYLPVKIETDLPRICRNEIILGLLIKFRKQELIRNDIVKDGLEIVEDGFKKPKKFSFYEVKEMFKYLEKLKIIKRIGKKTIANKKYTLTKPAPIFELTQFGYIMILFEENMTNQFNKNSLFDIHKFCPVLGKIFDFDNELMVDAMIHVLSNVYRKVHREEILPEKVEEEIVIQSIWNANALLNHETWVVNALTIPEVARIVKDAPLIGKELNPVFGDESTWKEVLKKTYELKRIIE